MTSHHPNNAKNAETNKNWSMDDPALAENGSSRKGEMDLGSGNRKRFTNSTETLGSPKHDEVMTDDERLRRI